MNNQQALLKAIADNPHDDMVRRVYADYLEEHGTPEQQAHAHLIRLQLSLDRNYALEDELIRQYGKKWAAKHGLTLPKGALPYFHRGFPVPNAVMYPITVDYRKTFQQMIEAGKFYYTNSDITSQNFPLTGSGLVKTMLVLLHVGRTLKSHQAIQEQERIGLRPATLPELLAYAAQQWKGDSDLVAALGSSWVDPDGDRNDPYLCRWYDKRDLNLDWYGLGWNGNWRFAAVRK